MSHFIIIWHVFALNLISTVHFNLSNQHSTINISYIMNKILDIQQSIIAANGNISLAKDLFAMLLDDLDVRRRQIEECFQSDDMQMLEEHIHKLYGATAYCIVPKLRDSTETLENLLRKKDYSQIKGYVDLVLEEIQQLISHGPNFIKEDWVEYQTTN